MSRDVIICECFARDGLQNEPEFLPTARKVEAIGAFAQAGFRRIEATSYSHPKWVPAFADASEVLSAIPCREGVAYKATCPNPQAVQRALGDLERGFGAEEISFLLSATESHSQKNLRRSREEQWRNVEEMAALAGDRFITVGVVSVALGCPFEGTVDEGSVVDDVARMAALGTRYATIGDTTGTATPATVKSLFSRLLREVPDIVPVAHLHNSRGSALANCMAALEAGCTHFDSSIGGVGGHPSRIEYGSGLTGNVATEDLVNLLEASGVSTGLDLDRLWQASELCRSLLGRELHSMVALAGWGLIPGRTQA